MSTQTREREEGLREALEAVQVPATFEATGNLRLIRVPVRKVLVGLAENFTEGLDYEFSPNRRLVVDKELIERDHKFFQRNDPDYDGNPRTLDWLRAHKLLGERFYEIPAEPPDPQETLETITAASARGDEEALMQLYEHEDRTFKRPQILKPIDSALRAIEERRALEQQPAEGASAQAGAAPPGTFRPPTGE